jgi:hypothetical protein
MKYFISILFIFQFIVNAQTAFTMKNMKIYYKDTIDNLSGSISYCADGYYFNDVRGVMMGQPFHQHQLGIWSYDTIKDQLTQTMYIARDVDHGIIVEDYSKNPSSSTTVSYNMKHTLIEGAINETTRVIKIEVDHALKCR